MKYLALPPVLVGLSLLLSPSLFAQEPEEEPEGSAEGPTVEQILERHYEARGGLDKIKAIETLEVRGLLLAQGFELPFVQLRMRPNRYRMDLDIQGTKTVQAYDGSNGWAINPMSTGPKPTALSNEQVEVLARQADFDGLLVEPGRKGTRISLIGKETLAEREVYRLEAKFREGDPMTIFLDAETMLETRRLGTGIVNGQKTEFELDYPEYRQVAGVQMVARQSLVTPMGSMEFRYDEYIPGVELDPGIFFMPGQKADAALSLAQVLEAHEKARLSESAADVETIEATGRLGLMGLEVPLKMYFRRPRLARLDADLQGLKMTLAYDGETAWTVSPMQGIPEPEALPADAVEAIALFSDFLWGLLADSEAKGWTVELAGVEKVERDETYKLNLVRGESEVRELYLGGEDFLERKLHLDAVFLGAAQVLDVLLSDYRQVGGVQMPHNIRILASGSPAATVKIATVETNVDLAEDLFSMPPAKVAEDQP